ncbi:MAG TPA: HD domain-containing phosphohydrolase [Acidimicrobiia bacterium]|nr:HD domain-containing phosphohydrolase [Acidimicrobiia bacterium]
MTPTPPSQILVVDDEEPIRRVLARTLGREGYECHVAADVGEARRVLGQEDIALVLADVNMPGESGLELACEVLGCQKGAGPPTAVVMVTGVDDPALAKAALDLGAYGYVIKPFERNEIVIAADNALRRRALEIENRDHRDHLELLVTERTYRLSLALEEVTRAGTALEAAHEEVIHRLAQAAEFKDPITGMHLMQMSLTCQAIALSLGFDAHWASTLRLASPMHDIGKIGVPDAVLLKPGKLDDADWVHIRRHPEMGHAILAGSDAPLLRMGAKIALTHHEKFDGSGYPNGLRGDTIPIESRIVAVADVYDTLITERPYKEAYSVEHALDLMIADRATHFDPEVLDAFLAVATDLAPVGVAT